MNEQGGTPRRPRGAHKGDFGRLLLIAGSQSYAGAAVLSAEGALRAGAGLVTCATAAPDALRRAGLAPEAMTVALPGTPDGRIGPAAAHRLGRALDASSAVVVGPGLGRASWMRRLLQHVLGAYPGPVLIDADALNAFAGIGTALSGLGRERILTPHPGEAGRLLGQPVVEVVAAPGPAAHALARQAEAVVLLKGHPNHVVTGDGELKVVPTGGPILARGGSGDVLAGLIGALLARGLTPDHALDWGMAAQGRAADFLAERDGEANLRLKDLAREAGRFIGEVEIRN